MSKKDKCKELMSELFGPSSAKLVDQWSEDECVEKCKAKVTGFLGSEKAKVFDKI